MSEQLRECPFCGKANFQYAGIPQRHASYSRYADQSRVICSCGAQGTPDTGEDAAIAAWNTRADATKDKLAEALRDMILDMDHKCQTSPSKRKAEDMLAQYEKERGQ